MKAPVRPSNPPMPGRPASFAGRILALLLLALVLAVPAFGQAEEKPADAGKAKDKKEEKDKKDEKNIPVITEAITVQSEVPKEQPVATVSVIQADRLEATAAKDLTEVLNYTSGATITVGSKNEWKVRIRGLDTARTTLLYDGIPVYEPYYNSYDLKAFVAADIDRIQVVKGASSILYGPNTLGGIVELITRRPDEPRFTAELTEGENGTANLKARASASLGQFAFQLGAEGYKTDGFTYRHGDATTMRTNSDEERKAFLGKLYFYPRSDIELMAEFNWLSMNYGAPWAVDTVKANYWRFPEWERTSYSVGGTMPSFHDGSFKFRAYYTKHYNVLDAYKKADLKALNYESTYDNSSWGFFALNATPLNDRHELRTSVNFRSDDVNTQSAIGAEWERYHQKVFSVGAEDYFRLTDHWGIQGGASIDYLAKEGGGENKVSVNPLAAVKYSPRDDLDFHLSLSRKSRFPTMRNLYSTTSGNPDLKAEDGTNVEFGGAWHGFADISGAVFYNRVNDLIDRKNLPDGTYIYDNIGRAALAGFECEVAKEIEWLTLSATYTYLHAENLTADKPLDLNPKHQLSFILGANPHDWFRFTLWGMAVSSCQSTLSSGAIYRVAGYGIVNASIERQLYKHLSIMGKMENLLNKAYITEPGFPMRSRSVQVGVRLDIDGANRQLVE